MNSNGSSRSPFSSVGPFNSSSPVSSLDSASQFAPSHDQLQSFETRLKASPLIHDLLDRLSRYEFFARDLQRDLSEVQRKVDLVLERSLGPIAQPQPEFHDPFAPSNLNESNVSASNGPRGTIIGGIAPNQSNPPDDIAQISQRLNTLTSSVGQILALQTQQHTSSALSNSAILHQNDLTSTQLVSPPLPSAQGILGHGLPNRPDLRPAPRAPNPPMRTWSVGALDLPLRPPEAVPSLSRQESFVRDKRRSVTGLMRRESAGVRPAYIPRFCNLSTATAP